MIIEIQGPRLTLRTMTRDDYHAVRRQYVSDPAMDVHPYHYDATKADAAFDTMQARDGFAYLGVFNPDGDIIGELVFKRIDRERGRCELGIALANDQHKGHGYGTEAFGLAARYALDTLGLSAVYADTMGSNVRMQRILTRLGFRCYLRMEDCYDMGDRWEDRLDYVLQRENRG